MKLPRAKKFLVFHGVLLSLLASAPTAAQIKPDATLPHNSVTTQLGNVIQINGGTKAGNNLFHSFSQFSIPTGVTAWFNNATDVQNIFSRVTSQSISNIDGIIRANGTANLFLLNPNGIVFGANARLNIGGSFLGSTASTINFADGAEFNATTPQTSPVLTVSVPVGLGFGNNPGAIHVQGTGHNWSIETQFYTFQRSQIPSGLQVQAGQTIALLGGDIFLEGGNTIAPAGRIELGSVAGLSQVSLTSTGTGWTLGYDNVHSFQDIYLSQKASVDTSGAGGGNIQIQGRNITSIDGSAITAITLGTQTGGSLTVNATESLKLIGATPDGLFSTTITNDNYGAKYSGNLTVNAKDLMLINGPSIQSNIAFSGGHGSNLLINVSDVVNVSGAIFTNTGILSSGLYVQTSNAESAGNLIINTKKVIVSDGGFIGNDSLASGQGGHLTINASESVDLSSVSRLVSSTLTTQSITGAGGDLSINTSQLNIQDISAISVSSFGSGKAGNTMINANVVKLNNDASINASTVSGEGGNIQFKVQSLQLSDRSKIATTAGGTGNGGNINIDTKTVTVLSNSAITANAFRGRGGNISINTQAVFRSPNSAITASSQLGVNGEVNITTIDTNISKDLIQLTPNLVSTEQVLANSCLARRNKQQGRFIITGNGGLAPTPYDPMSGRYTILTLKPLSSNHSTVTSPDRVWEPAPWKIGDPIVEAQGIVRTKDGRILLTSTPENATPESANSLVCHPDNDLPKS